MHDYHVTEYSLVAIKRDRVPEWLWRIAASTGLVPYMPFRWMLTRPLQEEE